LVVEQLRPSNVEKSDVVQIAFLLLVAGNATMVNMIALVRLFWASPYNNVGVTRLTRAGNCDTYAAPRAASGTEGGFFSRTQFRQRAMQVSHRVFDGDEEGRERGH
jgi:hypothetical protein